MSDLLIKPVTRGKIWSVPETDFVKFRNSGMTPKLSKSAILGLFSNSFLVRLHGKSIQAILAGTLTGVQGDIRCKVLAALSTVK